MTDWRDSKTVQKWSLALFWLLGITILLNAYSLFVPYGVRYVFTDSIPRGLYGSVKHNGVGLQQDQGVCFRVKPPQWIAERGYISERNTVCKYVLGLPGDRVVPRGDELFICREDTCRNVGAVRKQDAKGRPSFPAFTAETVIPDGYYYIGSTYNPRSLDSRYLGLISAQAISVKTYPIWTY